MLEFAIIAPLTFLLLIGLLVGGMGVFRYQEMAAIARESSRWAAVHGTAYARATGHPAATAQDVYTNVIAPKAVAIDTSKLAYSVTWDTDNAPYHTEVVNGQLVQVTNKVKVTLVFQWIPEAFLGGITLTSTSESAMSY
jgi:Flp pilus assembly protein TadG